MQASIMNDLLPGYTFSEGFCGFPTLPCRYFHTLLDCFLATSGHPETGALRNKCCEDIGSNVELPSPHSSGTCSSKGRHTRRARLPIATLGRVLENDGGSLSNLCAQTLGQHTSNVPEFCFDVPPRTACRCPELDPPAFADPALRVSKASISLETAHISTHERGGAHCWMLDRQRSVSQPQGPQWRKGTQEISLAREHGDILLYTDSLASFPGYVLSRDVKASRRRSRTALVSLVPTLFA